MREAFHGHVVLFHVFRLAKKSGEIVCADVCGLLSDAREERSSKLDSFTRRKVLVLKVLVVKGERGVRT